MAKKKERAETVWISRMAESLLGRSNDVVKLAWLSGEEPEAVEGLDLSLLSEFKRSGSGTVEVKLVDRAKALSELVNLLRQGEAPAEVGGTQAAALYRALENRAGGEAK